MPALPAAPPAPVGNRSARRCGLDLTNTAHSVDKHVRAHEDNAFVSAVLAELDCTTGILRLITAGHPPPLLLRDGKSMKTMRAPTALPLGLWHLSDRGPRVEQETLQPGDQLLIYTDGIIEARTPNGEIFGRNRLAELVAKALADQLPLPETMRRLVHAILAHQHHQLHDDATATIMQWRTPPNRQPAIANPPSAAIPQPRAGRRA